MLFSLIGIPRTLRAGLLVLSLLVSQAPLGHAEAQTDVEVAEAEALVTRGVELRRRGDDEGALVLLNQAYALAHRPRALAQVALAEQALGHYVSAETHMIAALAVTGDPWIESRRESLQEALAALRTRLGTLELRGGIEGADIRIDGVSVAHAPLSEPIRVPAGSFRLEVVAPGYYPFTRTITIVPEGTTRETVEMTPTPSTGTSVSVSAQQSPEVRAARARSRRTYALGVASLTTGSALLATSIATFVVRQHAADQWNSDACLDDGLTREANCRPHRLLAERSQNASIASLAIGGALVTTGIILLVTSSSDAPPTTALACGAVVGRTTGGSCAWRF